MDWLSPIGGLIGGLVSEFGADKRAKLNRDMQIAENQKNREWEEHMYNTYESPSAQKQQMLEAGLNPMGAVSPQSVGSASTSSLPTNSGAANAFGSAIQQAIPQFYEAALAKKQLRLADLEAEQQTLENWKQAFENGNAQELYDIQKEEIQSRSALTRQEQKLKAKELEMLDLTYNKAKEAYEAGINEYVDEHDKNVAQTNNMNASTLKIQAETDTINQLREHQVTASKLSNAEIAQRTENLKKEYDILKEQATQMSDQSIISGIQTQLSQFYGADISQLIPSLQYKAAEYYRDYIFGDKTYESTINAFNMQVSRILEKDGHIIESSSSSYSSPSIGLSASILKQSFGVNIGGASESHSSSR